jgi:hypothetical protein
MELYVHLQLPPGFKYYPENPECCEWTTITASYIKCFSSDAGGVGNGIIFRTGRTIQITKVV